MLREGMQSDMKKNLLDFNKVGDATPGGARTPAAKSFS